MKLNKNRARLTNFERLEQRDVPAAFTWDGGGANSNWSDKDNWVGNAFPNPLLDAAITIDIPANTNTFQDLDFMTIDRITLHGNSTVFLPKQLRIDGSAPGDQIVNAAGNNSFFGSGGIELLGSVPRINVAGGSTLLVAANLTGTLSGGTNELQKDGTGTLELQGIATFQGNTHVRDGILALNHAGNTDNAVPATSLIVGDSVNGAAELRLLDSNQVPNGTSVVLNSDAVFIANGKFDTIGNLTLNGGALGTSNGAIRLGGNVNVTADSAITIGDTSGMLDLFTSAHTIDVAAGKNLTISAQIIGSGDLIKTGAGTITFDSTSVKVSNTYTGTTTVKHGGLLLNNDTSNAAFAGNLVIGDGIDVASSAFVQLLQLNEIPNTSTITIDSDGRLDLNGFNETIGGLAMDGGASVVTGAGTLTLNNAITVTAGTASQASITGNLLLATGSHQITVADNVAGTDLVIDGVIIGDGGFIKNGSGQLEIKGLSGQANTYTGSTTVQGGVLALNHNASNVAVSKSIFINGGILRLLQGSELPNDADIHISNGGVFDLNGKSDGIGTLSLEDNGVSVINGNSLGISGIVQAFGTGSSPTVINGNLFLNNQDRTFNVSDSPAQVDLKIDAIVSFGGIVKSLGGLLELNGNNTYTGATTINAGTLRINGTQPNSAVTLNAGVLTGVGSLGNVTAVAGTIAPGSNGIGTLTTKNFTLGGATYTPELNGPAAFDQLKVVGNVNLTGGTLAPNFNFVSAVGNQFTILDNDGGDAIVGLFAGMPEGSTIGLKGRTYKISYLGGDGNDVVLADITAAPAVPPAVPPVVPPASPPAVPPASPPAVPPASPPIAPPKTTPAAQPLLVGGSLGGTAHTYVPNNGQYQQASTPTFFPGLPVVVRTATADVNGDGVADFIGATGPGSVTAVTVIDGASGATLTSFQPFESSFTGGLYVAAADLDGDGKAEVVVTPDQGGGPIVAIYRGSQLAAGIGGEAAQLVRFSGIDDDSFRGGARVTLGDLNGDGTSDMVVAAGFGGGPRMAIFDGADLKTGSSSPRKMVADFFAYEADLRNGAFVAAGDLTGDGIADLAFGGGPGGAPRVRVFDGHSLLNAGGFNTLDEIAGQAQVANFFAGGADPRGGVRLALKDATGDGKADLVAGSGEGEVSRVRVYEAGQVLAGSTTPDQQFDPFGGVLMNGVFVG